MDILSDVKISGNLTANSINVNVGRFTQDICGYDLNFQRGNLGEELCIGNNISIKPCGIIESRVTDAININSMYIYKNGCVSTTSFHSGGVSANCLEALHVLNACISLQTFSEFYYKGNLQPYYRRYEVAVPPECSKFKLYETSSTYSLVEYPPIIQSVSQDTARFVSTDYQIICGCQNVFGVNVLITPDSETRNLKFGVFSY